VSRGYQNSRIYSALLSHTVLFFGKKIFVRKKISQNVFWINWSSGVHEEKFLE
jgi:hypothetical protein